MAEMVLVKVDIPESVLALIDMDRDRLSRYIKHTLAVELYREGKLSLGKAAELAGAGTKWEMLLILSERGATLNYTAEDARADIVTLRETLNR